MKYGTVPGITKPVARLVQGGMTINAQEMDRTRALLDEVYALGCNTFDTAHVYAGGESERGLGRWMKEKDLREKIVIITKGAHPNADRKRVTPFDIASDLHDSLARLQTEYIDLYLLHRDDPAVPVGLIVETLNELVRAGKIHAFGGSNWTHTRTQAANEYASAHGLRRFAASSPHFSLAIQVKEPWADCVSISGPAGKDARDWYTREQMPLLSWSSLAGGFFAGRVPVSVGGNPPAPDDFPKVAAYSYGYPENFRRLQRVAILAQEKGLSVPQVALAYVLNQPMNIFALVGCVSGAEYQVNTLALDAELTPAEMAWLDLQSDSR